jgi:hypothetical protein
MRANGTVTWAASRVNRRMNEGIFAPGPMTVPKDDAGGDKGGKKHGKAITYINLHE